MGRKSKSRSSSGYEEPGLSSLRRQSGKVMGIPISDNAGQRELVKYLRDPNYEIVFCFGDAGTGKTLISAAVGLEQKRLYRAYSSVMYIREPLEVGASLGYLPGEAEDKYSPYLGGLYDNIRVIAAMSGLNENGLRECIECEPPQYMRGRSLDGTYAIVDEAQNLSLLSIRTLLTRMGKGSKVVLLGSENQVDIRNWRGGETDFGKACRILSGLPYVACVRLTKSERSEHCAEVDRAFSDFLSKGR